jgi:hypothetical protein
MTKSTLFAIALASALPSLGHANEFVCSARQAQVHATVVQKNYVIENGHDPVCLVTLNVTSLRPSTLCPLMMGDINGGLIVETNYRYSAEECRAIPSRISGVLNLPEDQNSRGFIEID